MTAKKPQLAPTVQRPTDLPASPPPPRAGHAVDRLCGCGKPVRYMVPNGDGSEDSCNKYMRCPTYEQLQSQVMNLRQQLNDAESEWMNRYADMLGCDPRPAAIAVKLERFMVERDTMQRTIGSLRSQLKFMRDSEPIPPPSLPTDPSNVAAHVPRAEQAAPTKFADGSQYF